MIQVMPRSRPGTTKEAMEVAGLDFDNPQQRARFVKAMQRERAKGRDYRYPRDQWYGERATKWDLTAVAAWAMSAEKKREAGQ